MKKVVAVFLCVILAVAFCSCNRNVDPKQAYEAAVEKNAQLTSSDTSTKMKMTIAQGENSMEIHVDADIKLVKKGEQDFDLQMKASMGMPGLTYEYTIYYTDGYCYIDMLGQKVKSAMDVTEMTKSIDAMTQSTKLSADLLKDLKLETSGSDTILSYTVDESKMMDVIKEMVSGLGQGADQMFENSGVDVSFQNIEGTTVLNKDGYVSSQKMKVDFQAAAEEETATAGLEAEVTVTNPGQTVTIEMPDFSEYTEGSGNPLIGSAG